jgi:hypothetical protein
VAYDHRNWANTTEKRPVALDRVIPDLVSPLQASAAEKISTAC